MATIEESFKGLYEGCARIYNECVIEEIKNNNELAANNYDYIVETINKHLSGLKNQYNFDTLSCTNKISLSKILELKAKAVTRKVSLSQRIQDNEIYKINKVKRNDASSYSGFASAFKKFSKPKEEFKTPNLPNQAIPPPKLNKRVQSESQLTRKSLDLPRTRPSSSRRERPKSIDLTTVNQAALLAWEVPQPKKVSPPSRSQSQSPPVIAPHRVLSSNSIKQKKKYEYVKPTVNTQITLTPVNKHPSYKQRTKSTPILVKEGIPSPSIKKKKYKDERVNKMMDGLSGVDEQAVEQILDEIMVTESNLTWDDLAGLNQAKQSLKETVVYPFLRPDLFKGLREPISGMLLFGPPGTGKTMIAKTVANESNSTFFSISASSLLSKYLGESEKLIRALFYVAKKLSPSIIFFDEIDSLLTARAEGEQESSRRVKTEFLIQWSSLSSSTSKENDLPRVLVLAATNLPWSIDEAARRRFSRRLYIPLPEFNTRLSQLQKLMLNAHHSLSESDFIIIANITDGYSNSDLTSLAKEAAMEPIRDLGESLINIGDSQVRSVNISDFDKAMTTIKMSVGKETLKKFEDWANRYGSTGA